MQCVLLWLWLRRAAGRRTSAQIYSSLFVYSVLFFFTLFPILSVYRGKSRAKDPWKAKWRVMWDKKHIEQPIMGLLGGSTHSQHFCWMMWIITKQTIVSVKLLLFKNIMASRGTFRVWRLWDVNIWGACEFGSHCANFDHSFDVIPDILTETAMKSSGVLGGGS